MTAGLQFSLNLQQWAPAAQDVDLGKVLQHHKKEAEVLKASNQSQAEQQQNLEAATKCGELSADGDGSCDVSSGDYKGCCSGNKVEEQSCRCQDNARSAGCTGAGRECSVGQDTAATSVDAGADYTVRAAGDEPGSDAGVGGEDGNVVAEDAEASEEVANGAGQEVGGKGAKRDTEGAASQLQDQPQVECLDLVLGITSPQYWHFTCSISS
jgi:hypothetical protein